MRRPELVAAATCAVCSRKIGAQEHGLPMFFRLTIEQHAVDLRVVNRQAGLEAVLGSPLLAHVMGPDEDMTVRLMEPATITVCYSCALEPVMVHHLAELAEARRPVTVERRPPDVELRPKTSEVTLPMSPEYRQVVIDGDRLARPRAARLADGMSE